jgi:uncharacterized membrane protein
MNALVRLVVTGTIGAAGMYWLDPDQGRRRRALARDKLAGAAEQLSSAVRAGSRDLKSRARGAGAEVRARFSADDASDEVLAERVRSALGRVVSHPRAIEVLASDGRITLVGDVLAREHDELLATVSDVRGVVGVADNLSVHEQSNEIPALQGGRLRRGTRAGGARENWSPATRLIAGASGAGLLLIGSGQLVGERPHRLAGVFALALGGALVTRSFTNAPLRRLAGAARRGAIDIRKTIFVQAPVEQVFATLADYQNFPSFMRNVRSVRMQSDSRSHWEVAGPGGVTVEWDSETTVCKPNELLAWRSVASSTVSHAGIIRFERAGEGTRLDIQMSYNPPAGALGHAAAKLFGADPKKELDQDLLRLKTLLESGVIPRDTAQPDRFAAP